MVLVVTIQASSDFPGDISSLVLVYGSFVTIYTGFSQFAAYTTTKKMVPGIKYTKNRGKLILINLLNLTLFGYLAILKKRTGLPEAEIPMITMLSMTITGFTAYTAGEKVKTSAENSGPLENRGEL